MTESFPKRPKEMHESTYTRLAYRALAAEIRSFCTDVSPGEDQRISGPVWRISLKSALHVEGSRDTGVFDHRVAKILHGRSADAGVAEGQQVCELPWPFAVEQAIRINQATDEMRQEIRMKRRKSELV